MKSGRNTLLAGVAALALVAGTGLTSAQAAPDQQDHKGAATVKEPSAAASPTRGGAAALRPRANHSAQNEKRGAAAETKPSKPNTAARDEAKKSEKSGMTALEHPSTARTAEMRHHHAGKTAEERHHTPNRATARRENSERNGKAGERAAQRDRVNGTNTAARERSNDERLRGLQANASGTNMQFSDQQRTQIRNTVIEAAGAPRVNHVDFDVAVGIRFRAAASPSCRCRRRWCGSTRHGAACATSSSRTR